MECTMQLLRGGHALPPAVLRIPRASQHWVGFASMYGQGGQPGGPGSMSKNSKGRILLGWTLLRKDGLTGLLGGDEAAAEDTGAALQGKRSPLCRKINSRTRLMLEPPAHKHAQLMTCPSEGTSKERGLRISPQCSPLRHPCVQTYSSYTGSRCRL